MTTHAFTVTIDEIYDHHQKAVDLARLFALSEERKETPAALARPLLPTTTGKTTPMAGVAGIFGDPRNGVGLSASTRLSLEVKQETTSQRHVLTVPKPKRFRINRAEGYVSRAYDEARLRDTGKQEITLPFFASPLIGASELKFLFGWPKGVLLKQEGARWRIVEDAEQVDLRDRTQSYRLGPIEVYS